MLIFEKIYNNFFNKAHKTDKLGKKIWSLNFKISEILLQKKLTKEDLISMSKGKNVLNNFPQNYLKQSMEISDLSNFNISIEELYNLLNNLKVNIKYKNDIISIKKIENYLKEIEHITMKIEKINKIIK